MSARSAVGRSVEHSRLLVRHDSGMLSGLCSVRNGKDEGAVCTRFHMEIFLGTRSNSGVRLASGASESATGRSAERV